MTRIILHQKKMKWTTVIRPRLFSCFFTFLPFYFYSSHLFLTPQLIQNLIMNKLKILSYNIEKLFSIEKLTSFLNTIKQKKIHIIALSELDTFPEFLNAFKDILSREEFKFLPSSFQKRTAILFKSNLIIKSQNINRSVHFTNSNTYNYIEDITFCFDNINLT